MDPDFICYRGFQRYSIVRTATPASAAQAVNQLKILLSNDDGYRAEGLAALGRAIKPLGAVTIVAPDRNRSGASNSLTLDVPVSATRYDTDAYYVNGTPTDCVHLAVSGLFDFEHDIVVSGVNDGANLGDDTLYSGTVAAAVEGRYLGLPAIAVSLCMTPDSPRNFALAADIAAQLVRRMAREPLQGPEEGPIILNVNVPDVPDGQLRGIKVTRLGSRHRAKPIVRATDPRGRDVYWVGNAGAGQDAGPGTDFHAVAEGYASITPLQIDLTRHAAMSDLKRWLDLE
jgi:5'-nucleotidase